MTTAKPFKIDLGCSFHKLDGYLGIDILPSQGVDVIADTCKLPFRDECLSEIYSRYALKA